MPDIIYLDSAHEADETYLELVNAWRILPNGGVLLGDDWSWDAVKNDVVKFSKIIPIDMESLFNSHRRIENSIIDENILLYDGQWVLFKQ